MDQWTPEGEKQEDPARQARELMERAEAMLARQSESPLLFTVPLDSVVSELLPPLYHLAQHTEATNEARRLAAELLMTLVGEVYRVTHGGAR